MNYDKYVCTSYPIVQPCNCIGPQNGEPLCPCRMREVEVVNGRYKTKSVDLGPVVKRAEPEK